jgi:hypothetical protein
MSTLNPARNIRGIGTVQTLDFRRYEQDSRDRCWQCENPRGPPIEEPRQDNLDDEVPSR